MHIIAVVDDSYGLMFNHRRLSRDRVLTQKIIELSSGSSLRMNSYTAGLFDKLPANAVISDDFLEEAQDGDFCFIENVSVGTYASKVERVYLYHWNRAYPSDFKLDFIPSEHGMKLVSSEDFTGYSHEKITGEVWES